jgi:Ca2+-binding RTX toxin-like protein
LENLDADPTPLGRARIPPCASLNGGAGDDVIIGGPGTDTIDGAPGDDVVIQSLTADSARSANARGAGWLKAHALDELTQNLAAP